MHFLEIFIEKLLLQSNTCTAFEELDNVCWLILCLVKKM